MKLFNVSDFYIVSEVESIYDSEDEFLGFRRIIRGFYPATPEGLKEAEALVKYLQTDSKAEFDIRKETLFSDFN